MKKKIHTIGGLPPWTAVVYASLFIAAFWFYSVLWTRAPVMAPDSESYLRAAQDLSDFHIDQLQERAPGYPLLLLVTASSQSPKRTLFFVSLLLHFASIWLLATALYSAGLGEMTLNIFCFILLLPPYVQPAAYMLSENLTAAMLVAGFVGFVCWCLHKKTIWILISALTIGYAALTRPTYQLLALAMAGYLLIARFLLHWTPLKWKDMIKADLILICGSVVILGGYAFVNYRSVGYFGVTTPVLGLTLSQKTLRVIERLPDEYAAVREILIKARNSALVRGASHTGYTYINDAIPELTKITGLEYPALSNYMLRINLLLIQKAPLEYLQDVVWTFASYWFPSSDQLANLNSRPVQLLWAVIHFCLIGGFALNLILLAGAATYIKKCKSFLPPGTNLPTSELRLIHLQGLMYGLAGTIVIYTAALSCLIETGNVRYRVPTDGLIVFMVFLGAHLWRRLVDLPRTVLGTPQGRVV